MFLGIGYSISNYSFIVTKGFTNVFKDVSKSSSLSFYVVKRNANNKKRNPVFIPTISKLKLSFSSLKSVLQFLYTS